MKHYASHNTRLKDLVGKYEQMPKEGYVFDFTKSEALLISDYYESEKLPDMALEVLNLSINYFDRPSKFQVRKTRLLIYHYNNQVALDLLDKQKLKGLKPSQVKLLRLEILISQGKMDKAFALIDALKKKYKTTGKISSDIFYMESLAYDKVNDYKKSFDALKESLCISPNHSDALGKIWITTELSRQSKQSIKLHEYLLNHNHYSSIKWFNLAHALYSENEYERSLEAFEFAIIINEDFESAYIDLADVAMQLKQFKKAKEHLEVVYERFGIKEIDVLLPYAECLLECNELERAQQILEEGINLFENDPQILFLLGETFRKGDNIKQAIECYNQSIQLGLDRDDAYFEIGLIHADSFDFFKAEECFKEAIDLNEHYDGYRSTLASLYLNIGEKEMSESTLSAALVDIPSVKLEYHYGAILFVNGKTEKALTVLGEALESDFDLHEEIFEFAPELQNDKRISALIKYYRN